VVLRQGLAFLPPSLLSGPQGLGPAHVPSILTNWLQLLTASDQLAAGMQQLVQALGLQLALQQQQQQQQQQQGGKQQPGSGSGSGDLPGSRADLGSPDAIAQQAADQRNGSAVNPGQQTALFDWSTGARPKVNAVVKEVLRLLGVEAKAVAAQQLLDMAEGLVASRPEELLVVVVRHCQQLLGVEGVEGVVPALNKVSQPVGVWGQGRG
jgi:hypothetical protein